MAPSPDQSDLPAPATSSVNPDALHAFRAELSRGIDVVDPKTWAGSIPAQTALAPRIRIGRSKWFNLLWLLPIGFALLLVAVAAARELRELPAVEAFIA